MSRPRRFVTFIVHRDGQLGSKSIRLPLWLVRVGGATGSVLLVAIVVGAILYAPIVRTAARVPGLTRQIEDLTSENRQVHELAKQLGDMEASYSQLRTMLGGDVVPEVTRPEGSLPVAYALFAHGPGDGACYERGKSTPRHWPLDQSGIVTRGPVGAGSSDEVHTGLDIAVPTGTPIRAAGGGVVVAAGNDPEYGLYIRIEHPDGYVSMYGHASRVLTAARDSVSAGQVIGLSGSTGRSTAPHLHFEISSGGQPVDPAAVISRECSRRQILVRG